MPTLEERRADRELKRAHHFKLQKRLDKAKKHASLPSPAATRASFESAVVSESIGRTANTRGPRPDPAKLARQEGQRRQFEKEQRDFEREIREKQRLRRLQATKHRRAQEKRALMKRNDKGQLLLSHQVGHLLDKIQKSTTM